MYPRSVDRAALGSTKTACADVRASEAVGAIRQWVSPRPRSLPAVRETRSLSASTLPGLPMQPVHASRDGSFFTSPVLFALQPTRFPHQLVVALFSKPVRFLYRRSG
jgi:hypothetical protein